METAALESPPLKMIGTDRLLSVNDVTEITGFSRKVSRELIEETGKAFEIRGRHFVFESVFLDYLQGKIQGGGVS